ncbi:MAG TPA: alpha/beta hydrolase [Gammaproteobacteria bacterium]|nr:alpha/beta hydrolase [Gammaproteobacteria bacterium]
MIKTRSIKITFAGSNGNRLDARLELPVGKIRDFIIFSHCFTCTKDILTAYRSSRILAKQGYAVLRFDFSGLGDSEGDFAECNFSTTVEDLHAAINFLAVHYEEPAILMGHSLGGTSSLAAAIDAPAIRKVITIASPSQPEHVLHHFEQALTLLEQGIPASFEVAGKFYDINPQFVDDVRRWDMQQKLTKLDKPVLIFNVKNDALVSEDNASEIERWVKGETLLIDLDDTDHLLSDRKAHAYAISRAVDWLEDQDAIDEHESTQARIK